MHPSDLTFIGESFYHVVRLEVFFALSLMVGVEGWLAPCFELVEFDIELVVFEMVMTSTFPCCVLLRFGSHILIDFRCVQEKPGLSNSLLFDDFEAGA